MLRSRNTQLVGELSMEQGKRVSIENLKRLVSENFPAADLKVNTSNRTIYVHYILLLNFIVMSALMVFLNHFVGGAHESANVSATSQGHLASTGIPCDGKGQSRLEWRPGRLFRFSINIGWCKCYGMLLINASSKLVFNTETNFNNLKYKQFFLFRFSSNLQANKVKMMKTRNPRKILGSMKKLTYLFHL